MTPSTMRLDRPTDHLPAIAEMYAKGLGFTVLARFQDHAGFDGVILGHPDQSYPIEFTAQRGHTVGVAPTKDHLLVFFIPNQDVWTVNCEQMRAAGFRNVSSYNPYWDLRGKTFEDPDGYRVCCRTRHGPDSREVTAQQGAAGRRSFRSPTSVPALLARIELNSFATQSSVAAGVALVVGVQEPMKIPRRIRMTMRVMVV